MFKTKTIVSHSFLGNTLTESVKVCKLFRQELYLQVVATKLYI